MNLAKLVIFSRKIHRLMVWLMIVIGGTMLVTGLVNLYPEILFFIPPGQAAYLHVLTAPYFAIVLAVQMLTGSIIYFYPRLQRLLRKPSPPPVNMPPNP
jgi:hypothetical protein